MMKILTTKSFDHGLKLLKKKHKSRELKTLHEVIPLLCNKAIGKQYRNHPLVGSMKGHNELHLSGDVLLIYTYVNDDLVIEALLLKNITDHSAITTSIKVDV